MESASLFACTWKGTQVSRRDDQNAVPEVLNDELKDALINTFWDIDHVPNLLLAQLEPVVRRNYSREGTRSPNESDLIIPNIPPLVGDKSHLTVPEKAVHVC
jgi:hypothetical protein